MSGFWKICQEMTINISHEALQELNFSVEGFVEGSNSAKSRNTVVSFEAYGSSRVKEADWRWSSAIYRWLMSHSTCFYCINSFCWIWLFADLAVFVSISLTTLKYGLTVMIKLSWKKHLQPSYLTLLWSLWFQIKKVKMVISRVN